MARPKPVPNARRTRVIAKAATAPATIAGHDTPETDVEPSPGATTTVANKKESPSLDAKTPAVAQQYAANTKVPVRGRYASQRQEEMLPRRQKAVCQN